ncbi:MAG: hypothetical protein LAO76_03705 [Acidobacteriia bacterium]|nr:hypothetical protein [Terriglobia bacterium]
MSPDNCDGLVGVISHCVSIKLKESGRNTPLTESKSGGSILEWLKVALPKTKDAAVSVSPGNLIDRSGLINARQSFLVIVNTNNQCRKYSGTLGQVVDILWPYRGSNANIQIKRPGFTGEHNYLLRSYGLHVRGATESVFFSSYSIPIFAIAELWHEKFFTLTHISDGVANICKRQLELNGGIRFDSLRVRESFNETDITHYWEVPSRLNIDNFDPGTLTQLKLLERCVGGFVGRIGTCFGSISGIDVGAHSSVGETSVERQNNDPNHFRIKLYRFAELLLFVLGSLSSVLGGGMLTTAIGPFGRDLLWPSLDSLLTLSRSEFFPRARKPKINAIKVAYM